MNRNIRVSQARPSRAKRGGQKAGAVKAAPVAISEVWENTPPRSLPGRQGGVRFAHREFIGDFTGGADYSANSLSINPGLGSAFPWLSYIALVYESYIFHRLRFHMIPLQPTSQTGQNFMVIDYDAADSAPTSKFELLNMKGAKAAAVWLQLCIEADPRDERALGRARYIRAGDLASNLDVKTYDIGVLHAAAQGLGSTVPAYSLLVEYDVELLTPQFSVSTIAGAFSAKVTAGGTVSSSAIYGDAATMVGGLDVEASGNTLTFNRVGQYLVDMLMAGTGLADATNPTASGTADYTVEVGTLANAGGVGASYQATVNVLEAGQTFVQDWSGAATTITSAIARIAPYLYSAS
jgi:hypothetical protein